jgi:general secretion pathway protein G
MNIKLFIRKVIKKLKSIDNAGFSLIEILIALTLLALVGTFVAGKMFDQLEEGKVKAATIQMGNFKNALKDYRRKCNFYPTSDQGLEALLSKPSGKDCKNYPPDGFLDEEEIPLDPWDEEFVYDSDGKKFNIISYGRDAAEGGEGFDADISLRKKK